MTTKRPQRARGVPRSVILYDSTADPIESGGKSSLSLSIAREGGGEEEKQLVANLS